MISDILLLNAKLIVQYVAFALAHMKHPAVQPRVQVNQYAVTVKSLMPILMILIILHIHLTVLCIKVI